MSRKAPEPVVRFMVNSETLCKKQAESNFEKAHILAVRSIIPRLHLNNSEVADMKKLLS